MPSPPRVAVKAGVRRLVRRLGYDLTPTAAGIAAAQRRVLGSADAVIDVGANVGQFAERTRDLGFRGPIVSFEPGADAFEILAARAARDSARQWDARRLALSSSPGQADLNVSANSVSSSLLQVGELHLQAAPRSATATVELVDVSTLDHELREFPTERGFLKLDVQGVELQVLEGGAQALAKMAAVQVEVSFERLYDGQDEWLSICSLLREAGFAVYYLEPGYEDFASGQMLQADLLFHRVASVA